MKTTGFLFVAFLILSSCRCEGDIDCEVPLRFPLNLIEKSSGKDFFFDLEYTLQDLSIVSKGLDTLKITDENIPKSLVVYVLEDQTNYTLYFNGKEYEMEIQLERNKIECCFNDLILVKELHFDKEAIKRDNNGYYRIEL